SEGLAVQIYLHQAGGGAEPPWLLLAGLALVLGLYLGGVERVAARGRRWRIQHSLSFVAGVLLLGLGFSLPALLGDGHSFSGHAAQHVLVGMVAPVAL